MIGIKVYPNFTLQPRATRKDRELLESFTAVKEVTQAQYVNFAVYDYSASNVKMEHYLTYPMEWITHYVKHSFMEFDPLLTVDYRRVSFVDWKDLWRSEDECRISSAFQDFGIGGNGLSLISHLDHQVFGALSLVYDRSFKNWNSYRDRNMELLRFQSERIGKSYLRSFSKFGQNKYKLTKRELECLHWVAVGKTDAQIALLMGIGRWTVVGHIKSAKYKLDCPNRPAAIARAVSKGLLDIYEPV
ncbi:MAG: autoinducer binding domain-containing protein [Rhizobiaceae bacterium]|nr:autoinducer binding domain-containing protein [Rhizobiaceae bacterium]